VAATTAHVKFQKSKTRGRMEGAPQWALRSHVFLHSLVADLAAVQSWMDVPNNILVYVSAFLPYRADRVHMASVNLTVVLGLSARRPCCCSTAGAAVATPVARFPQHRGAHLLQPAQPHDLPAPGRRQRCALLQFRRWRSSRPHVPGASSPYHNLYSSNIISLPLGFRSLSGNTELPLVILAFLAPHAHALYNTWLNSSWLCSIFLKATLTMHTMQPEHESLFFSFSYLMVCCRAVIKTI
jgi:hypothetical protein